MAQRIKTNYYTTEKYKWDGHKYVEIDNGGYLFSNGTYKTKLTKDDLPDTFIEGIYYAHLHGFLQSAGVVDLFYKPNKFSNHMFKDDFLYISYNGKIGKSDDTSNFIESYKGYDEYVWGYNIVTMLKAIEKNSNYDISKIKEQIEDKRIWFKENYPQDYNATVGNFYDFWKED